MAEVTFAAAAPVDPKPWMAQMPNEYKKHEALAQFDGPMAHVPLSLVKGYIARNDEFGKLKAEHDAIEKPPEEYKLEDAKLPDDAKIEGLEDLRKEFLGQMKEISATNKQANLLWQKAMATTADEIKQAAELDKKAEADEIAEAKARADAVTKTLKEGDGKEFKGWGVNYDAEMRHVKLALERFSPKGADGKVDLDFLARPMQDGTKLGDSVPFVMMFHEIGKRMGEAAEITGAAAGRGEETLEQKAARMYPETPAAKTVTEAPAGVVMPGWAKEMYATTGR